MKRSTSNRKLNIEEKGICGNEWLSTISSDGLEYIINSIESSGSVFTCFTLRDNKKLCSVSLDLSSMYDFLSQIGKAIG